MRIAILDMDVTDDQVHGSQEGAFFNSYYHGVCYARLYIFCGAHLLAAKLRSSKEYFPKKNYHNLLTD